MKSALHIAETIDALGLGGAHLERCEIAIQDILLADPLWSHANVCGSRVYRLADPGFDPDKEWPMLGVAAVSSDPLQRLQGENEFTTPVEILLLYNEHRVTLEPAEHGSRTFALRLWQSLWANRFLNVSRYGVPLLQQGIRLQRISYGSVVREDEDSESGFALAGRYLTVTVDLRYTLDRDTGQPAGWSA